MAFTLPHVFDTKTHSFTFNFTAIKSSFGEVNVKLPRANAVLQKEVAILTLKASAKFQRNYNIVLFVFFSFFFVSGDDQGYYLRNKRTQNTPYPGIFPHYGFVVRRERLRPTNVGLDTDILQDGAQFLRVFYVHVENGVIQVVQSKLEVVGDLATQTTHETHSNISRNDSSTFRFSIFATYFFQQLRVRLVTAQVHGIPLDA